MCWESYGLLSDEVWSGVQAQSAAADDDEDGTDGEGQDHVWDFIRDGLNMLIRSATLQVRHSPSSPHCRAGAHVCFALCVPEMLKKPGR